MSEHRGTSRGREGYGYGGGSEARPIELIANFFRSSTTGAPVYHYDVDIVKEEHLTSGSNDSSFTSFGKHRVSKQESASSSSKKSCTTSSHFSDTGSDEVPTNRDWDINKYSRLIIQGITEQHPTVFQGVHFVYDGIKNFYSNQALNFGPGNQSYKFWVEIDVDSRPCAFVAKLSLVELMNTARVAQFLNRENVPDRTMSPTDGGGGNSGEGTAVSLAPYAYVAYPQFRPGALLPQRIGQPGYRAKRRATNRSGGPRGGK